MRDEPKTGFEMVDETNERPGPIEEAARPLLQLHDNGAVAAVVEQLIQRTGQTEILVSDDLAAQTDARLELQIHQGGGRTRFRLVARDQAGPATDGESSGG